MILSAPQLGKTTTWAAWLVATAAMLSRLTWWTAPTYEQCDRGLAAVEEIAKNAGILKRSTWTHGAQIVELRGGGVVKFRSWDHPEHLSGETVHAVVVDEAHLLTRKAHRIIRARRSATLGPLRYSGNAEEGDGTWRQLCERASDPAYGTRFGWHHWTWRHRFEALGGEATEQGRAYRAEIDAEREQMLDYEFEAAWEAKWVESDQNYFRLVSEATVLPRWCHGAPGTSYAVGWDIAESHDFTVGIPVEVGAVPRGARFMERFGVDYTTQEDRICEVDEAWGHPLHVVEVNGPGKPLFSRLKYARGLRVYPFTTTMATKHEIVRGTAADIRWKRLLLADLPPLQSELRSFMRRKNSSGKGYVYSAPSGGHDDCVVSLCLGNFGAKLIKAYSRGAAA